jgi:hypothetical protein
MNVDRLGHLRRSGAADAAPIIVAYRSDPSSLSSLSEIGRAAIAELANEPDTANAI